jgi:RNA-binding protein YhbY
MAFVAKFQIGKQGITEGTIVSLDNALKNHHQVRISVLKSAGHDRSKMPAFVEELKQRLPVTCSYRVIGFTIILNKLGKTTKKPLK